MSLSLEQLLDQAEGLISFPDVCLKVNALVNSGSASAAEIGAVIEKDPALTARLLKIANSPFYGFASSIETVSRAVTVLGGREIRDLAFATSAIKAFDVKPGLETVGDLWSHNVYCAIAGRQLAAGSTRGRAESIFVAGLLHDIGRLLFISLLPETTLAKVERLNAGAHGEANLYLAEQEVIGFDHATAGGALIRRWGLPDSLYECVRYHHQPASASEYPLEVSIVHLADCVAHAAQDNSGIDRQLAAVDPLAWDQTGLTLDDLENVLPSVLEQSVAVKSLLQGGR